MASSVAKRGERVLQAGAPLSRATGAMILLHGRGASGQDMLHFAEVLAQPDFAYLAPQAEGRSWYPYSFLAPIEQKEPYLTSSMLMIDSLLADLSSDGFTGPDSFARLLSRRLSGARIRRPARRALRRGGRAKRRTNRARGDSERLFGSFFRNAGVSRVRRHRSAYTHLSRSGDRSCPNGARRGRNQKTLSRDGAHHKR
jgi:hypothetical protein